MSLFRIALMILINSSTVEYLTCRTIFLIKVAVAIAAFRDPTICRRRIEVTSASTNLKLWSTDWSLGFGMSYWGRRTMAGSV
jgi:hypothetical protein